MPPESLLLPDGVRDKVADFFEARAAAVDAGQATTREGLAFLQNGVLRDSEDCHDSLLRSAQAIATLARSDMSTAFALWCHRMVCLYLSQATPASPLRTEVLPRVLRAELLGSTALAAGMAHFVCGAPLPVTARRDSGGFVLQGRTHWASNLCPLGFIQVTTAATEDVPIVVALPSGQPGLEVDPYPRLLALQSTQSAGVSYRGAGVPDEWVITRQFVPFIRQVRPAFLVLQSSFCWGLAHRALAEAAAALRGPGEALRDDLALLDARLHKMGATLYQLAAGRCASAAMLDLVRLRLEAAQLATAAVMLESKAVGGRSYQLDHATNRRFREAAFLPIQAPTEAQLRGELAAERSKKATPESHG
jgi:alkylation response protein AidB-like acyl-CoA dehydrogenase